MTMQKEGESLPGKKGISVPREQWAKLCGALPALVAQLAAGNAP